MNHLPPHRADEFRDQLRIIDWLDWEHAELSTRAHCWIHARMLDLEYSDE